MAEQPFSASFAPFRRQQPPAKETRAYKEVYFDIHFDAHGAYLQVCNQQGEEIVTSYLHYSGPVRNLLHSLEQIRSKQD